ncbi:RNA-directed DNA polymerase, eukaryota [Tanacetum coccineum]
MILTSSIATQLVILVGSFVCGILIRFGKVALLFWIILSLFEECGGKVVLISIIAVYAPHDPRDKRMLWDYLMHVINRWNGEVIIVGDFNEVRYKSDRFGSIFNSQGADEFNSFIVNVSLEEVPLGGSTFTWCHESATKMSKLDRFLVSNNLFTICPHISVITLERYLSDHRPILLREAANDYGPVPFRFFHHWLELDGFCKFVVDTWNIAPIDVSNGMRNMVGKMRYLKLKIREWIKSNRPNRKDLVDRYKDELWMLDVVIDKGDGTDAAKIKWAVEGDENTRFFHGILNKKRNQQNIRGVMVDGVWNDKPHDVKNEFLIHFWKRFEKPLDGRATVEMSFLRSLSIEQQKGLECCNSSFVALIPKVPNANLVNDFRPISLIRSIYKVIAKILANRLVGVLGIIVNEVQSAFIVGRQILDGPFILNEVMQWCKIKKKQSLVFKVDFEKAYDSVRWDFLDDVLKKFGFGNKWCNWIQECLRSSRGSILVNGSPTEEFQFFKGLKQGDPLSPFLFILIMESLHLSFQRVVDAGMFKGIKLSQSLSLSHMFYADDAVFVGQWSDGNINTLIHVLDCFYSASGLRINMSKSKIMGVNVEDEKVKHAASKLGCLTLKSPFLYLGTKVGATMSRVSDWKEVVEKVKSRLSKWKMKALSIGGRLTLLKSVQKTSLWANVIKAIHGEDGNVDKAHYIGGRTCWTSIVHEVKKDNWCSGGILKDLFPRLYALESCNLVNVCMKLNDPSLVWNLESSGDFSVSSIRKVIDEKRFPSVCSKTRWVKYVSIKVNVLAWKIKIDALLTRFNISHRGIDIHSILCPVCDGGVESLEHLFFRCHLSKQIARKVSLWWNVAYVDVN